MREMNKYFVIYRKLVVFLLPMLLVATFTWGQNARPKIGLVLSGGGAKGIAHIRILQVLDSLGIVPDYVAGTSMGSIVGALYASGYGVRQIDSITRAMDWEVIMSNSVTFNEINIEEKDEFGRYVYELPMVGLKPQFPLGLIEGQHVEELLAKLFFPVSKITDFSKLPTPFLCVATDIVKGEPVVLKSGSLAMAVRASMSIPTVFSPVKIGKRLLVDGGVYVNFPVTYCRQMGADFIIGVDVGGGLYREDELNSAAKLLLQTTFLASNESYEREKKNTDIYINAFSHMKFGTMDFEEGESMMQAGDTAVKEVMPRLVELANRMKSFPARKVRRISQMAGVYKLEEINQEGVSDDNKKLVLEKFGWKAGDIVTRDQIASSVHKLMGTRLFSKINYQIAGDTVRSSLTLNATERPNNTGKFAIHYDTDRGAGLILNFTKRNLLLPASRFVGTLDLAENPRARANYFYYVGKRMRWWHQTEAFGEKTILNSYFDGTPIPDVKSRYAFAATQLNYSFNPRSFAGLGAFWLWSQLKPSIDPRTEIAPPPVALIRYQFQSMGLRAHYTYNTFNRVYFPSRGAWIRLEGSVNLNNPFESEVLTTSSSSSVASAESGKVQHYLRLNLKGQQNFDLTRKLTLQLRGQLGFTQEISSGTDRFSAYRLGAGDFFSLGGQLIRQRSTVFPFLGLRESELAAAQVMMAGAQLQVTLAKNLYVIPGINLLAAGYDSSDFWQSLGDFDFSEASANSAFYQLGYGVSAGYMSLLGPLVLTVSSDPQIGKIRWFLNIGFNF